MTFQGLEYPDCKQELVFTHRIMSVQRAVHYQDLEV